MSAARARLRTIVTGMALALGVAAGGCLKVDLADGFPCSATHTCPSPYQCRDDGKCYQRPTDGGGAGGSADGTGGAGGAGGATLQVVGGIVTASDQPPLSPTPPAGSYRLVEHGLEFTPRACAATTGGGMLCVRGGVHP